MMNRDFERGSHCPDRRDDIIVYIFDEMGPGAAEAFEAHLASCEGCRREVESLKLTLQQIGEVGPLLAGAASSANGQGTTWEEEWKILRRRLASFEDFPGEEMPAEVVHIPVRRAARVWIWRAAAAAAMAAAFAAGYLLRPVFKPQAIPFQLDMHRAPALSGASAGNYFDNLEDFTRDTHNFLRRTRMVLMEFTNMNVDSDPTFFREASSDLLSEVIRYRDVASRMHDRKLGELLDQISGVLTAIARVEPSNQGQVVGDVKSALDQTGLISALELLDAGIERGVRRQSNV